jgi:hypothetical protein
LTGIRLNLRPDKSVLDLSCGHAFLAYLTSLLFISALLSARALNPAPSLAGVFDGQNEVFANMDDCSDARTSFDQCDGKPSPYQGVPPPRAYPECPGISWKLSAAIVVGQHKVQRLPGNSASLRLP